MMVQYIHRIERIDQLIRHKSTGSPKQLAQKLNVSERLIYRIISYMREMGAPISYCSHNQSYIYTSEVMFDIGFKPLSTHTA